MKPEIKAMLPELPRTYDGRDWGPVFLKCDIEAWLDKLTEVAEIKYGSELGHVITTDCERGDTHRYLVIPLGEIKKQTPLEIAVEALTSTLDNMEHYFENKCVPTRDEVECLRKALAQIEAAK